MSGSCSSGRRAGKLSDPFHVGDSAPSRSDRMSLTAVERVLVTNPLTAAIFASFDGRGDAGPNAVVRWVEPSTFRFQLANGQTPEARTDRFRALGCRS